jgi:hypothetical protein
LAQPVGRNRQIEKQIADGTTLVRRESTIRDRWDNMRANALANNPTLAERQLFHRLRPLGQAGGVTEGSFRPQVQEGDTNFPPWIAAPTSAAISRRSPIFSKP